MNRVPRKPRRTEQRRAAGASSVLAAGWNPKDKRIGAWG